SFMQALSGSIVRFLMLAKDTAVSSCFFLATGKLGRVYEQSPACIFASFCISAKSVILSRIPLFVNALIVLYCRILHKAHLIVFPIPIAPVLRSDSPGGEPRRLGQEARGNSAQTVPPSGKGSGRGSFRVG